jgi:hypothetical protein
MRSQIESEERANVMIASYHVRKRRNRTIGLNEK